MAYPDADNQTGPVIGYVNQCPKLPRILNGFYHSVLDAPALEMCMVQAAGIPEPYHRLLVHHSDMTSTLTRFYGEEIRLGVLRRSVADGWLVRHVVLEGARTRLPVEYGAIRIHLEVLGDAARREVLACRVPLGRILNAHGVPYQSCPGGFFRVRSTDVMNDVLRLEAPSLLYGRCNCLSQPGGGTIAEVVEILPPADNGKVIAP